MRCGERYAAAVQVLGSGGPIPDDARASAGYLVWLDRKARLLVDAGGGVFLRFAESGARLEDLDAIAITHVHADHVADLPALLKGGYFIERERPLHILGPSGGPHFPSIAELVRGMLDPTRGIYRYLSPYLEGGRGWFRTPVTTLEATSRVPASAQCRNCH